MTSFLLPIGGGGGLGVLHSGCGWKDDCDWPHDVRIWEEKIGVWSSDQLIRNADLFIIYIQQQPWARHVHMERSSKPDHSSRQKRTVPCDWSVPSPLVILRKQVLIHLMLDLQLPKGDGREVLSPVKFMGQMTSLRVAVSTEGPCRMPARLLQHVGQAALNCLQELKIMPSWAA